jgi:hypothetical protein
VEPAALAQGVIFSFLGLILVGLSGKIARIPREHKALFLRLSLFGETALTRLFERDRFIQTVRGFWIFCGLLWLVSGLLILLKLSPPITLPSPIPRRNNGIPRAPATEPANHRALLGSIQNNVETFRRDPPQFASFS